MAFYICFATVVLSIKNKAHIERVEDRRKILLCVGSNKEKNDVLIQYLCNNLDWFGKSIKILQIVDTVSGSCKGLFSFDSLYFIAQDRDTMKKLLDDLVFRLKAKIPTIVVESTLREGYVDDEIVNELKDDQDIEMVLLIGGKGVASRKLVNSIVEKTAKEVPVPVLIIPED